MPTQQPTGSVLDVQRVIVSAPSAEDRALVEKYKSQIITIMDMNPEEKRTLFETIGYDPDKVKNKPEYAELQKQNWQNDKDMSAALLKVRNTTIGASVLSAAGLTTAASLKKVKPLGESKGLATIYTGLLTAATALITYFFATKAFTADAALKGKELSIKGRNAEVIEIARALAQRDIRNAQGVIPAATTPAQSSGTILTADTNELTVAGNQQHMKALENAKTPSLTVPPLPSFGERVKADADSAQLTTTR